MWIWKAVGLLVVLFGFVTPFPQEWGNLPVEHAAACQSGSDARSGHRGGLMGRRCRLLCICCSSDAVGEFAEAVDSVFYVVDSFFESCDFVFEVVFFD